MLSVSAQETEAKQQALLEFLFFWNILVMGNTT